MSSAPKGYIFWTGTQPGWNEKHIANSLDEALKMAKDPVTGHMVKDLFHVKKINEEGEFEILGSYWEFDEVAVAYDEFCEKYPYAYCEMFEGNSMIE